MRKYKRDKLVKKGIRFGQKFVIRLISKLAEIAILKAQVEGAQGYFETYENGVKTEWSA